MKNAASEVEAPGGGGADKQCLSLQCASIVTHETIKCKEEI